MSTKECRAINGLINAGTHCLRMRRASYYLCIALLPNLLLVFMLSRYSDIPARPIGIKRLTFVSGIAGSND
jgi:hypothetical protein